MTISYLVLDEEGQKKELESLEQSFFMYFKKARAKFYKCKQSLKVTEDENGKKYFGEKIYHKVKENDTIIRIAKKYKVDADDILELNDITITDNIQAMDKLLVKIKTVQLTDFEIAIITHLMLVEYMKQQLLATDVIKQSLSDKDFRIYSQANQLREINLLYRLLQRESRQMITEYTYMGMTDNAK